MSANLPRDAPSPSRGGQGGDGVTGQWSNRHGRIQPHPPPDLPLEGGGTSRALAPFVRRVSLVAAYWSSVCLLAVSSACLALPAYDKVERDYISTEAVLLDRHGEPIQELRVDQRGRRLPWVHLPEVSPAFIRIVLRAEDKRFYEHRGVDWLALSDAALDNLFSSKPRGASTLSMQVAAMLERELKARKQHRTLGQKWEQMRAARALESAWSKRQILEAYLNLSTFRGEIQGVGAASRALFGKH